MVIRFFFLLIITFNVAAQNKINGVLLDVNNIKPIAYGKIIFNDKIYYSDFDVRFQVIIVSEDKKITIEALGYENFECELDLQKRNVIYLVPNIKVQTKELENYKNAYLIIKKSRENAPKNDPKNTLNSFSYQTYQHLLVSANLDSLKGIIDTVYQKNKILKIDSSDYKFKKYIEKQDLFQYEKISEHLYKNKLYKENIKAIKMAGFDEPFYEAVGFVFQSLSLYEKYFEILGSKYLNPIYKKATNDYLYQFISVTSIQNRKIYQVYFKPKNNHEGLEGLLYIDAETYAIAKTTFKIRDYIEILSSHFFEYFENENLWMPKKMDFKITKGNRNKDIKFLGKTIYFEQIDAINSENKKYGSDFMYVHSQKTFFNHQFNPNIAKNQQFIAIDISENAFKSNDDLWKPFLNNTLQERKLQTYKTLDSIFKKNKVEKTLNFGRKIINGYLGFGPFDLDIRHFVKYSNFEGLRVGLGGITNSKFSKLFKIGGHIGYGLKDQKIKQKIETAIRIGNYSDTWLQASYENDLKEIASTFFSSDPRIFTLYDSRPLNFTTFFNHKTWEGTLKTNIFPFTSSIANLTLSEINPQYFYEYNNRIQTFKNYRLNIFSASFQINPFSDFMQTPNGRIEIHERFPKFTLQLKQTLPKIQNDLVFSKIDFKTLFEKKYLNGMFTQLYFQSGISFGDVPASHSYNSMPNNPPGENILERISFDANYGFETMYQNEFFSSTFIFFQVKHLFQKIKIFTDVEPFFGIVTRAGWGNIHNINQHQFIDIKAHKKGFYESGIEIQNLYFGLGLGAFYRYGPYQFQKLQDNLSIKFSFKWDFWL